MSADFETSQRLKRRVSHERAPALCVLILKNVLTIGDADIILRYSSTRRSRAGR